MQCAASRSSKMKTNTEKFFCKGKERNGMMSAGAHVLPTSVRFSCSMVSFSSSISLLLFCVVVVC